MILRVLRDIFARKPAARLPVDEAGFERLMQHSLEQGRHAECLAIYDAAIATGLQPCAEEFDRDYRRALVATGNAPYPLSRRRRFERLWQLMAEVRSLEGDFAECGCFRGMSSHLLLSKIRGADPGFDGHGYHVFDSFEGLSEPVAADLPTGNDAASERVRRMCQRGWFAATLAVVQRSLTDFPGVSFHPGWIPASFAGLPERRYRFVHLDLDLHDPTLAALDYFFPRLAPGAIVVCDDYAWPGARKAVDAFAVRQGIAVEATPHGQAVLRSTRVSA